VSGIAGARLLGPVRDLLVGFGYATALLAESLLWLAVGGRRGQPVRAGPIAAEMREIGVAAVPIAAVLAFTVGVSLAIQLIYTLREFGAESQVVLAIAKGVTREFGPLITGILVAGRTASALAARIGAMVVSQEVDALRVIGIEPVRYLVAPPLLALLVMMPIVTLFADAVAILGGGIYSVAHLDLTLKAYLLASVDALVVEDILQGLAKSVVFGLVIAVVGVGSGFSVRGGAEGVGRATTRAVVLAISWLVVTNMVFTFFMNR
jgi:phospholipid/cholesterol/gamma-HCH transport system permease protein